MGEEQPIWKLRVVKSYAEAHNHLLIGRVVDRDEASVTLHCRSLHFGRNVHEPREIAVGPMGKRVIPWSRVEIINELPDDFDYQRGELMTNKDGHILFGMRRKSCPIIDRHENRY
jgi:hypothetical protein